MNIQDPMAMTLQRPEAPTRPNVGARVARGVGTALDAGANIGMGAGQIVRQKRAVAQAKELIQKGQEGQNEWYKQLEQEHPDFAHSLYLLPPDKMPFDIKNPAAYLLHAAEALQKYESDDLARREQEFIERKHTDEQERAAEEAQRTKDFMEEMVGAPGANGDFVADALRKYGSLTEGMKEYADWQKAQADRRYKLAQINKMAATGEIDEAKAKDARLEKTIENIRDTRADILKNDRIIMALEKALMNSINPTSKFDEVSKRILEEEGLPYESSERINEMLKQREFMDASMQRDLKVYEVQKKELIKEGPGPYGSSLSRASAKVDRVESITPERLRLEAKGRELGLPDVPSEKQRLPASGGKYAHVPNHILEEAKKDLMQRYGRIDEGTLDAYLQQREY